MWKVFSSLSKEKIKDAVLVVGGLIILTVTKTAEICIAVAGLTYFWKEMFLPDISSGQVFYWLALPALVLISLIHELTKKNRG